MRVGDEIRSLARFTTAQRTAFRKLLKKYRKWTESDDLEKRFRHEVLEDPNSFTNIDLEPPLHEYSETLQKVRALYEKQTRKPLHQDILPAALPSEASIIERLNVVRDSSSSVAFDTALATTPIGNSSQVASYFVHPEFVVELQVLLLQHLQFHTRPSRTIGAISRTSSQSAFPPLDSRTEPDTFTVVVDEVERLAHVESAVTVEEREHVPGKLPQRAKYCLRWTSNENGSLAERVASDKIRTAVVQNKYAERIFANLEDETRTKLPAHKQQDALVSKVQELCHQSGATRPLYKTAASRSRFVGINDGPMGAYLAALDSNVSMSDACSPPKGLTAFPFAVLQVRQEGKPIDDLISILDKSHLVERVRGFSLPYHALWTVCKPRNMSPPFWTPLLSQDIRKLPPLGKSKTATFTSGTASPSRSATNRSTPTVSTIGVTDGTTAVEMLRSSDDAVRDGLHAPPARLMRKKRKKQRSYPRPVIASRPAAYWNEYDRPEQAEEDRYVLFVDPNEPSFLDNMVDRVNFIFGRNNNASKPGEESPALHGFRDEESSSDDDDEVTALNRGRRSYGAIAIDKRPSTRAQTHAQPSTFIPAVSALCFLSSIAILLVTGLLALTSKHKYATWVRVGTIFAVFCSVGFALVASYSFVKTGQKKPSSYAIVTSAIALDVLGAGWLLVRAVK